MAQAKRKLAAILSADVAGYSRLMADDEAAILSVADITAYITPANGETRVISSQARYRGRTIGPTAPALIQNIGARRNHSSAEPLGADIARRRTARPGNGGILTFNP